jgi:hypothetical protein
VDRVRFTSWLTPAPPPLDLLGLFPNSRGVDMNNLRWLLSTGTNPPTVAGRKCRQSDNHPISIKMVSIAR